MDKMKRLLLLLALFTCLGLFAQNNPSNTSQTNNLAIERPNPIEVIMEESEGNIVIDIPDNIMPSIIQNSTGTVSNGANKGNLKTGINRMTGYRIQVFSDGRDQSTLESRARARGNLILSRFPKYRGQIYTFSNSPNWYCRVGNFRNSEDASNAMAELKKAFPSFSGDMRIVKSPIVLIK